MIIIAINWIWQHSSVDAVFFFFLFFLFFSFFSLTGFGGTGAGTGFGGDGSEITRHTYLTCRE